MGGLIRATLNIALSLIVGAIALAMCAYYLPDRLEFLQIHAGYFKDWIMTTMTSFGSTSAINVWVRFLVQDEQLVFMGFVIVSRVVLYFILGFLGSLVSGEAFRVEREYEELSQITEARLQLDKERKSLEEERRKLEADRRSLDAARHETAKTASEAPAPSSGGVEQLG